MMKENNYSFKLTVRKGVKNTGGICFRKSLQITITFHRMYKICISSLFNILRFGFSASSEHNENYLLVVKLWMPN